MFVGMFGLIAAAGLSNLQFVNMSNRLNLFIIGISLFAGLPVSAHFGANPINWSVAGDSRKFWEVYSMPSWVTAWL